MFWKRKSSLRAKLARLHPDRVPLLWLAVILLAAAALRLVNIGTEPLWGDEILSRNIALTFSNPSELLSYLGQVEVHPPLYYFVLQGWGALFGLSDEVVRFPSLLFSLGVVAMVYVLGVRMLADRRLALLAAALTAYLPIQIEYGQEARPYSAICLMGCLAVWAVWEYLGSGRRSWLALYVLVSAAGMYLHYSYGLVLVTTAIWWFLESVSRRGRRDSRALMPWLLAHAAVFLTFWPWLDEMLMKITLGDYRLFGLTRKLSAYRPPNLFADTLDSVVWLTKYELISPLQQAVILLASGTFLWLTIGLVRKGIKSKGERKACLTLLLLTLLPVLLFVFAPQSIDYTNLTQRHVLFVAVPLSLLISWVAVRSGARRGAMLVAVLAASMLLNVVEVTGDDSATDFQHRLPEAAQYVNEHYQEGDLVIVVYNIIRSSVQGYLDEDIPVVTLLPVQYGGLDIMKGHRVQGFVENEIQARIPATSRDDVFRKLDRLDRAYRPKRIWVLGLNSADYKARDWFDLRTWRHSFPAVGDLIRLDCYTRR